MARVLDGRKRPCRRISPHHRNRQPGNRRIPRRPRRARRKRRPRPYPETPSPKPANRRTAADPAGQPAPAPPPEPTQIITGKKNPDGTTELRLDTVVRQKPGPDDAPGKVDFKPKSKAKARDMINKGEGVRISADRRTAARPSRAARAKWPSNPPSACWTYRHGGRQRHHHEPARQIRPHRQPGGPRPQHPRNRRQRSRPPPARRRTPARPGPPFRAGQPQIRQAAGSRPTAAPSPPCC